MAEIKKDQPVEERAKNYGEILLNELKGLRNDIAVLYDEIMFANILSIHQTHPFRYDIEPEFEDFIVSWMNQAYNLLKQDRKDEGE